jgi:hypothetical protein
MVPRYFTSMVLLIGDELSHRYFDLLDSIAIGGQTQAANEAEDHGLSHLLPRLLVSELCFAAYHPYAYELTCLSVCIISVYRMCTLRGAVESQDPPWDNVGAAIWSVIELNCAIICASLPTLRPLVAKVVPGMSSNHSGRATYERYGSKYATSSASRARSRPTFLESKQSPRSISTEELALSDMSPGHQRVMPRVYAEAGRPEPIYVAEENSRHILVTTETMVRKH